MVLPPLPEDVAMNPGANRGGLLIIKLRPENGEELPFVVDTGTAVTLFDKSWELKLGKSLGTIRLEDADRRTEKSKTYAAPKLYFPDRLLASGDRVGICDNGGIGILGMDCLRHYCIQLDFAAGKMRFLDPEHLQTAELGRALPLKLADPGVPVLQHSGFGDEENLDVVPDTGCNLLDGLLEQKLLLREIREQKAEAVPVVWIDGHLNRRNPIGCARFPYVVWKGENYTNVLIGTGVNAIGMGFWARHEKVTFNFPKRMMYLGQLSNTNRTDIFRHENNQRN